MRSKYVLAGWALSALATLVLLADAATMLFAPERLAQPMRDTGFTQAQFPLLASILVLGTLSYLMRPTALIGAIVLTGFLGGAICAHVRVGELASAPEIVCVAIGVLVWCGLALRDPAVGRGLIGARASSR
jgi:hypothetical protein